MKKTKTKIENHAVTRTTLEQSGEGSGSADVKRYDKSSGGCYSGDNM